MFRITGVLLVLMGLLVSCVTPEVIDENAVLCTKCEALWVTRTEDDLDTGLWITYRTQEVWCPDCESAVLYFFKTGKLGHECKTCGGVLKHCTIHPNTYRGRDYERDSDN